MRKVKISLFEKSNPEHSIAFEDQPDSVKALCMMNYHALAFHVYEFEPLFFGKSEFICCIDLTSITRLRPFGRKKFKTLEEAIEFGKKWTLDTFPDEIEETVVA